MATTTCLPRHPTMALELQAEPESQQGLAAFRHHLVARGYQEAVTYSFVDPDCRS